MSRVFGSVQDTTEACSQNNPRATFSADTHQDTFPAFPANPRSRPALENRSLRGRAACPRNAPRNHLWRLFITGKFLLFTAGKRRDMTYNKKPSCVRRWGAKAQLWGFCPGLHFSHSIHLQILSPLHLEHRAVSLVSEIKENTGLLTTQPLCVSSSWGNWGCSV